MALKNLQAGPQAIYPGIRTSAGIPTGDILRVRTLPRHWKLSNLDYRWMRGEKEDDPQNPMFSYDNDAELPPLSLIKNFLNFYVSTTKGRLSDKPTIETVHNACNCVTVYLHRKVGKKYPPDDLNDLYYV